MISRPDTPLVAGLHPSPNFGVVGATTSNSSMSYRTTEYNIDRATVDKILENQADLIGGVDAHSTTANHPSMHPQKALPSNIFGEF